MHPYHVIITCNDVVALNDLRDNKTKYLLKVANCKIDFASTVSRIRAQFYVELPFVNGVSICMFKVVEE